MVERHDGYVIEVLCNSRKPCTLYVQVESFSGGRCDYYLSSNFNYEKVIQDKELAEKIVEAIKVQVSRWEWDSKLYKQISIVPIKVCYKSVVDRIEKVSPIVREPCCEKCGRIYCDCESKY